MIRTLLSCLLLAAALFAGAASTALAQDQVWIQIEARPTQEQGEARLNSYYGQLGPLSGYRLRSGWHAIVLGPYPATDAAAELSRLRSLGQIPADSFLADGSQFAAQFWPNGAQANVTAVQPAPQTLPTQAEPVARLVTAPEETLAEARASERALTRTDREQVQTALQWEGVYTATIDGSFGPGTRAAMAAYQRAQGFQETGVLTTRQRTQLVEGYRSALDAAGLVPIEDAEAGIAITLPGARVVRGSLEAPFVRFDPVEADSGYAALLISQAGDRGTLAALYEVMQTLEIVPLEGERGLNRDSFVLTGSDAERQSLTVARHENGKIRGFTLVWPAKDAEVMARISRLVEASFRPFGDEVLSDDAGWDARQGAALAGLSVRKPEWTRSGFYIGRDGSVLTAAEGLATCTRLTVEDDFEVTASVIDADLGIAVLRPSEALAAPDQVALAALPARADSDVAVAGYSYGGRLGAPTLTYGRLAELTGLSGEPTLQRLSVSVQPGDVGGAVFDASGQVLGVLQPAPAGTAQALPPDVQFATRSDAIRDRLAGDGVPLAQAEAAAALPPETLSELARRVTVRVNCWR